MSSKQQKEPPNIRATDIMDIAKTLDSRHLLQRELSWEYTRLIQTAETAERYDDMRKLCKKFVFLKTERGENLDIEQRNLLFVAYKALLSQKRSAWNVLNDNLNSGIIRKYKCIIEHEYEVICTEVLKLLMEHLHKTVENNNDESEVFYLKMIADYWRHLASLDTKRNKGYDKLSEEYYMKAMDIAEEYLNEDHPTRLGLVLNFSVCCYEILKQPLRAIKVSRKALVVAINKQQDLSTECSYKDGTLLMQLLRDNIVEWVMEQETERTIKLINGYLREMKIMYDIIIPTQMYQIFVDYYFLFEVNWAKVFGEFEKQLI